MGAYEVEVDADGDTADAELSGARGVRAPVRLREHRRIPQHAGLDAHLRTCRRRGLGVASASDPLTPTPC
ncbi:hypothetical protein ACFWBB_38470 [Streptomyces sp. NPDC060000]|uniref:hypothetical protein n=1 Tax=Streptomyces sp. NPDC060000 TaxID=3347031 RepID=UPI003674E97C